MTVATPQELTASAPDAAAFAPAVLGWYDRHGRHDLPWKQTPTPYRVWVSEVMLQQTQVTTVLPYYQRFMTRFADLPTLAAAGVDEVLALWSGLGYYARGRNLHRTAAQVMSVHGGELPATLDELQALPGIGRSTAGAILALAHGQRQPILDGNVKRVLARYFAVSGWPGRSAVSRELWQLSDAVTPASRVADYTQAIMDLGATRCTRTRPGCDGCPLAAGCVARATRTIMDHPGPRPKKQLPTRRSTFLLLLDDSGRVMLRQRPPSGLWGGLWGFPECPTAARPESWCREQLGLEVSHHNTGATLRHSFSHFHLDITPWQGVVQNLSCAVMEGPPTVWYKTGQTPPGGFAAPIARLLSRLDPVK